MKKLSDLLPKFQPQDKEEEIGGILRQGRIKKLETPISSKDAWCQDCGSKLGYVCSHKEFKLWFCGEDKCLEKDCEITKKMAQKNRSYSYLNPRKSV